MSLTTGRGPLSAGRAGRFSAPVPDDVTYLEPLGRRVRGFLSGRAVVDSEQVLLVHRPRMSPVYAFPASDVHGLPTEIEPAAQGYVRVPWDSVSEWYEEEELVHGHPRNPYHRVDCLRTRRALRVEVARTVLVDTNETLGVYETSLEPRLYVDKTHVRMEYLVPSEATSYCPYKGTASYWTAVVGDVRVADVAWSYEDPLPESLALGGMLSFYNDRASILQELPK